VSPHPLFLAWSAQRQLTDPHNLRLVCLDLGNQNLRQALALSATGSTSYKRRDVMFDDYQTKSPFAGILAALTEPPEVLAEAALDELKIERLCCFMDEDGPDTERASAELALAGLITAQSPLKDQIDWLVEDARAFAAYTSMKGATVYECLWTRGLLLGLVAMQDPEIAATIAQGRKITWPDDEIWPEGLPRTPDAAFAVLAKEGDEPRVGALGQSWLDAGIIPQALEPGLRPLLKVLVDFKRETVER
jgi:hypothetical protein